MKNLNLKIFLGLCLILSSVFCQAEETCQFSIKEDTLKLKWTAFKTTEKLAVEGEFLKFKILKGPESGGLNQAVKGVKFEVDKSSVSTGNPARDATLNQFFFSKLQGEISGEIKDFSLIQGQSTIIFTINNISKDVSAYVEMTADGHYALYGTINLLDFSAEPAVNSLNVACQELHKGKDGISKTWSEVNFRLSGALDKSCK